MPDVAAWSNLTVDFHLVDHTGVSYRLRPPHTYLFGRDEFAHFQINDALTSRRHCELRWEPEAGWLLIDLGSRNGTIVNGARIDGTRALGDHDTLRVGGQHLTFLILPAGADVAAYLDAGVDGDETFESVPGDGVLPTGGSFGGTLGKAGLLPFVEFVLMTGKSGRLVLDASEEQSVWFLDGAPRDASSGQLRGQEALEALLGITGATFRFQEGVPLPRGEVIVGDPRRLLASMARGHSLVDAHDFNRAQGLQARMLERIPSLAGYDIGVRYAAVSGVGGDFYDVGPLPDGKVLITLGDVSGHGVQGALVVAMALKTLRLLRSTIADPVDLLVRFNEELRPDMLVGQFMTLFAAVLEPATGAVTVLLAGHHQGYLVDAAGGVRLVGTPGMAIGMMGGDLVRRSLEAETFTMAPGSLLFQCTDGLLEAHPLGGDDEFGSERLAETLKRLGGVGSAAVLDGVHDALKGFTAG